MKYIDRDRDGGLYVCVSWLACVCVCDREQATERVGICVCLHLSLC